MEEEVREILGGNVREIISYQFDCPYCGEEITVTPENQSKKSYRTPEVHIFSRSGRCEKCNGKYSLMVIV